MTQLLYLLDEILKLFEVILFIALIRGVLVKQVATRVGQSFFGLLHLLLLYHGLLQITIVIR